MSINRDALRTYGGHLAILGLMAVFLSLALARYYADGALVFGGEGAYVFDYWRFWQENHHAWVHFPGLGMVSLNPGGNGLNLFFLSAVQYLTGSFRAANFASIFTMYFFPFLAMYGLAWELTAKKRIAGLSAAFYLLMPFTLYYLSNINHLNVYVVTAFPAYFWVVYRFYERPLVLFFTFGLTTAALSYAYTNPPLNGILQGYTLLLPFLVAEAKFQRLRWNAVPRAGLLLSAFVLFNFWWFYPLLGHLQDAQADYTSEVASNLLSSSSPADSRIWLRSLLLWHPYLSGRTDYDAFHQWLLNPWSAVISCIPLLLIVLFAFQGRSSHFLGLVALVMLFLMKGRAEPFGDLYLWLFNHVPLFNVFKTPFEKFGVLFGFLVALLMLRALEQIEQSSRRKLTLSALVGYLLFCTVPAWQGQLIPDYKVHDEYRSTREYRESPGFSTFRQTENNQRLLYRNFILPGTQNYQVALKLGDGLVYTGMEPVSFNTNKGFISAQHGARALYEAELLTRVKAGTLFGLRQHVVNDNLYHWFGHVGEANPVPISNKYRTRYREVDYGPIRVFETPFVPLVYVPHEVHELVEPNE